MEGYAVLLLRTALNGDALEALTSRLALPMIGRAVWDGDEGQATFSPVDIEDEDEDRDGLAVTIRDMYALVYPSTEVHAPVAFARQRLKTVRKAIAGLEAAMQA
jgi:hypothetical protein